MDQDFEIVNGIYLLQDNYELDLHNDFDFKDMYYSVEDRLLKLEWCLSKGDWVKQDNPKRLSIEFKEVSEFRFMPRDPEIPFTEDDCINSIGCLTDEDWVDGVFMVEPNQENDPKWLTAIDFMSGAVIALRAKKANAKVTI